MYAQQFKVTFLFRKLNLRNKSNTFSVRAQAELIKLQVSILQNTLLKFVS